MSTQLDAENVALHASARHADTGCFSKFAFHLMRRGAKLLHLRTPPCTGRQASLQHPFIYMHPVMCSSAAAWRVHGAVTYLRRTSNTWPVPLRPFAEARRQPNKLCFAETGKLFSDRQHHQCIYGHLHDSAMMKHQCNEHDCWPAFLKNINYGFCPGQCFCTPVRTD